MKKRVIALTSVIFIIALIFVWNAIFVPHEDSQKNDTTISYNDKEKSDTTYNIEIKEEREEKNAVESKVEIRDISTPDDTKNLTCTISVKCDTILKNIDCFDEQKTGIIPENGIIYYSKDVPFYEGESVFNVLLREMKQNKIHFEFEFTPVYETAYIKGIANIYEFDCGELSGWLYRVNGQIPNVGCSLYYVSNGDNIEILYTCEMGKDLGVNYAIE